MQTLSNEELDRAADVLLQLPKNKRELFRMKTRAAEARRLPIGVVGFKHFYWCVWRRELQPYAEEWVEAFASGKWTILECFRGSGKSTDLSITFMAYCLGKQPHTSVLIVQANDDSANKTSSLIASIIEYYSGWQATFPTIVPDKDRGWGAKGYFIKDLSVCGPAGDGYGEWLELCSRDHMKDPSLVGSGVYSADIVGMHPRRLLFDDVHDQTNSVFPRERQKVVDTIRANVLPVITKPGKDKPFIGVACTPWDEDDAYHVLYRTGLFQKHVTPILRWDEDGKDELDGRKCTMTWDVEEGFPIETVLQLRSVNSKAEFARMYLCDLTEAKARLFKWYAYPSDDIDWKLPMVGGVDYASTNMPTAGAEGGSSYFAMAYGIKLPTGGAVVADGIVDKISQAQAEIEVTKAQNVYPGWLHSVIESDGIGGQFIQMIQRNPKLRIIPKPTREVFHGPKEKRLYEVLSPLFERAVLRVSDADTEFLRVLRSFLENYPNLDRHAPEWDVADSVLWMVVGMPELFSQAQLTIGTQSAYDQAKQKSPWAALKDA